MQQIRLFGGPHHGRELAIQDHQSHIHVQAPKNPEDTLARSDADEPESIEMKEGTYSRVHGTQDFEWDGWVIKR